MQLRFQRTSNHVDGLKRRIGVALFDAANFALLNPGFLGQLALGKPQDESTLGDFTRELEVRAECFGRRRRLPALRAGPLLRPRA